MGTKKEKAVKGDMPQDVADNIFRMQMNSPKRMLDTPGTFKAKDQKVMAMSTMFQTPDPDGTLDLSTPDQNISYLEVDEVEIPASRKVENFAKDPQKFFNTMAAEAAARGWTGSVADYIKKKEQDLGYRGRTDIIETEVTDTLPGEKYQTKFSDFSQGFDSVGGSDKNKTADGSSKGGSKSGMVDTFSALDTRQAARKAIVEGRKSKQAAVREARAEMKAGNIDRKKFREAKKQAKLAQAKARTKAMKKITAQGQAQRSAGKNPLISTEFDPNQAVFPMKVMQFRKKYKK